MWFDCLLPQGLERRFIAPTLRILSTHRPIDTGARFRISKAVGIGMSYRPILTLLHIYQASLDANKPSVTGAINGQKRGVTLASLTGTNPQNASGLVFCVSGQTTALDSTRRCISFLPGMVEPYLRASWRLPLLLLLPPVARHDMKASRGGFELHQYTCHIYCVRYVGRYVQYMVFVTPRWSVRVARRILVGNANSIFKDSES